MQNDHEIAVTRLPHEKSTPTLAETPLTSRARAIEIQSAGNRVLETAARQAKVRADAKATADEKSVETRLSPGAWLRAVGEFNAPFGFDRMPTVWG